MANYIEMQREAYTRLKTAIDSSAFAILNYVPQVFFEGVVSHNSEPNTDRLYIYVATENLLDSQESITSDEPGSQQFIGFGSVIANIYVPSGKNSYALKSKMIGEVIKNGFRGQGNNSDVWFNNQTISELRPRAKQPKVRVTSEYNYYEQI